MKLTELFSNLEILQKSFLSPASWYSTLTVPALYLLMTIEDDDLSFTVRC